MRNLLASGTQNNNGQQVFDCVPANGIIPKAGTVEITVTFAPDHPSDYYADGVRIDLFGQEEQHVFRVSEKQALRMGVFSKKNMKPKVKLKHWS